MALNVQDMPIEVTQGDLVTRYVELGDMAIRHATLPAGTDMTPVLQGLPGDRCPSPVEPMREFSEHARKLFA
jgi:hypothetical protein